MNPENHNPEIHIDVEQISSQLRIRPHIYIKLVKSFAESLEVKMKAFTDALAENDRERMRMIMHEIKGTAGNLRLHNIVGPESVLHVAIRAGENPIVIRTHFEVLKEEVKKLQQYVAKIPDNPDNQKPA